MSRKIGSSHLVVLIVVRYRNMLPEDTSCYNKLQWIFIEVTSVQFSVLYFMVISDIHGLKLLIKFPSVHYVQWISICT